MRDMGILHSWDIGWYHVQASVEMAEWVKVGKSVNKESEVKDFQVRLFSMSLTSQNCRKIHYKNVGSGENLYLPFTIFVVFLSLFLGHFFFFTI